MATRICSAFPFRALVAKEEDVLSNKGLRSCVGPKDLTLLDSPFLKTIPQQQS